MKPRFFRTPADLRRWFAANHADARELVIGFHRVGSGKGGITYAEALDEALCFGWIDGIRRGLDSATYSIRFTPRTARSLWSAVNIARARELIEAGRMKRAGADAFERRDDARSRRYSYEQKNPVLSPALERTFRARPRAWRFFEAQPPSYRRAATWWVVSAKRDETRRRRLDALIERSAAGERLPQLTSPARRPTRSTS